MTWCCGAGALLLFLWVLLGTAVVVGALALSKTLVDRRRTSTDSAPSRESQSIEILEERYARGEIDVEEFEERRRALGSHRSDAN